MHPATSLTKPDPFAIADHRDGPKARVAAGIPADNDAADETATLDRLFLDRQCCGDETLQAEVLGLYVASLTAIVDALPLMDRRAQDDAAHRIRGASQGIGAWVTARAAGDLEGAEADRRPAAVAAVAAAFAEVERAIRGAGG